MKFVRAIKSWILSCFSSNEYDQNLSKLCIIKQITLENGLEVVFIKNNTLEKSAMHIVIDAGANQDPPNCLGLAHLLEHLVLKVKETANVSSFVDSKFGNINGTIDKISTNFYIHIDDDHFDNACYLMAKAISEVNITKEICNNEIEILNHEFLLNCADFYYNLNSLINVLLKKPTLHTVFQSGNKQTLSVDDIDEKAKQFYEKHYTGDQMKLIIASKLPLDEMITAANHFNKIKKQLNNKSANKSQTVDDSPIRIEFDAKHAGKLFKMQRTANSNILCFYFVLYNPYHQYKHKSIEYLQTALIHSYNNYVILQNFPEKLITSFIVNKILKDQNTLNFIIEVHLTKQGVSEISKICNLLHEFFFTHVPSKNIFEETKIRFNKEMFEQENALDIVNSTANAYSYKRSFDYIKLYREWEFDETAIVNILNQLSDSKNMVMVLTVESDENLVNSDPFYQFKYGNGIELNKELIQPYLTREFDYVIKNEFKMNPEKEKKESFLQYFGFFKETMKLSRKEYTNGMYMLIKDRNTGSDECSITVVFKLHQNMKELEENMLFYVCVFEQLDIYKSMSIINCIITMHVISLARIAFTFTGTRHDVLKATVIFNAEMDGFVPTDNIIAKGKQKLYNIQKNLLLYDTNKYVKLALQWFLDNCMLETDDYKNRSVNRCTGYHVSIYAAGDILPEHMEKLFAMFESTAVSYNKPDTIKLRVKDGYTNRLFMNAKIMLFAYQIQAESQEKAVVLCKLMQLLLKDQFFYVIRYKKQMGYEAFVDTTFYKQKSYLLFVVVTTVENNEINDIVLSFISECEQLLKQVEQSRFSEVKKHLYKEWDEIAKIPNQIFILSDMMRYYGIHKLNIINEFKNNLRNVNLDGLANIQLIDPIILSFTAKE